MEKCFNKKYDLKNICLQESRSSRHNVLSSLCPVAVMWWSLCRQTHIFRHMVWLMFALYITWIWESEAERGDSGIIWKYWEYVYWVRYKASLSVHLLDKIILDYTIIGSSDGNPIWIQLSLILIILAASLILLKWIQ